MGGFLPACVAGLWLLLAVHADGSASSAAGCVSTALRGSFTEVPGSRGTGHVQYTLRLRNTSSRACTMAGRPSLRLLDRGGQPLPTAVTAWGPSRAARALTLWPGGSARAMALLRVDIPGRGDVQAPGAPCHPTAVSLRVGAAAGTLTVVALAPATPVCEGGAISLRPLVASEQQDYFRSPAGVECELAVNAGKVSAIAYCQTGSPPRSVTMSTSGHLQICSGNNCLSNPPLDVPVLAYGHHTTLGPFRCQSSRSGVRCRVASGRGFRISRSGIKHP